MELRKVNIIKEITNTSFGFKIDEPLAREFIEKNILTITTETLVVFDFRNLVFEEYFAEAFGDVYKKSNEIDSPIDVIYQLQSYQIDALLEGITTALGQKYIKRCHGTVIEYFTLKGQHLKTLIDGNNSVTCYGSISPECKAIYDYIDENPNCTSEDINRTLIVKDMETLIPALTELQALRMVYKNDKYYFTPNYILNPKNQP